MTKNNKKNNKGKRKKNEEFEDIRDEGEMDQEMTSREEREVEGGKVLSNEETLSSEEDNAQVDSEELRREISGAGSEDEELQDPPERKYAISSTMVRNIFVGSGIAAVVVVVLILTLTSAIDQARYTPADQTQYERTLTSASQELSGYSQGENGRVSIPIEQAIAITAERGLNEIDAELGVPQPQGNSQDTQNVQSPEAQSQQTQGQANQDAQSPTQNTEQAQQNAAQAQAQDTEQLEQAAETAVQSEQNEEAEAQQASSSVPEVLTAGESVYTTNCVACHQANGQGITAAFPTLANHVPSLYNADRGYLINVLLYGLQGQIQVNGQGYNGVMTAWQQLSDQEIADVLNYVSTNWENNQALQDFQPYTPEEIAAERDKGLSSSDVYNQRPNLQ